MGNKIASMDWLGKADEFNIKLQDLLEEYNFQIVIDTQGFIYAEDKDSHDSYNLELEHRR